jgi:mono/diheme cytochrome c family protein
MKLRALTLTFVVFGLLVACGSRVGDSKHAGAEAIPSPTNPVTYVVSAVTGPSWLKHLGLSLSQTHMGQMGGDKPIPASLRREPRVEINNGLQPTMRRFLPLWRSAPNQAGDVLNESFVLAGADLYRLNCRSCHGPDGKGSPPEINSLIGPVQAASGAMILRHMKARGTEISDDMAREMAAEAEKSLRDRLQNGGKTMPPFNHLRGDEVEALLAYLDQLAGVPAGNHAARLVTESAARVGEHMVKGTCHICHDATGPGGGHMAMMHGITPSLASLPEQQSLSSITHQVQNGSSGMMMMMGGPQMPSFPYFTDEEVAAAYFYLEGFPPKP